MEGCGHSGISRFRTYIIVVMRSAMKQIYCPVQLRTEISSFIKATVRTTPSDYLTASDLEVKLEAAEVARVRGIVFRSNSLDLSYLLNDRELDAIEQLCKAYEDRFEEKAINDCNLVFFLGDNPGWAKTWSAVSKRIPTYRRNSSSGKMWYPSRGRWLTHAERLGSLSLPVRMSMANAMGVCPAPIVDPKRAAQMAGNAMSFQTCAIIQMVALSCFTER
ncbi:unnamed protein product [Polarella glacialis]|uniref:Uncharacterized protein n=1 Tax=Polarella glacialis TaxID=89957 RepID=A0A813FF21_POLGL|nr:unnamed protein product [Polarella glacialis]CAE8711080.1 unnamed protein product [Polarella glacialis]